MSLETSPDPLLIQPLPVNETLYKFGEIVIREGVVDEPFVVIDTFWPGAPDSTDPQGGFSATPLKRVGDEWVDRGGAGTLFNYQVYPSDEILPLEDVIRAWQTRMFKGKSYDDFPPHIKKLVDNVTLLYTEQAIAGKARDGIHLTEEELSIHVLHSMRETRENYRNRTKNTEQ